MPHRHSRSSVKVSKLQMKGILTLSLFLLTAEGVATGGSDGDGFRNPFGRRNNNNKECSAEDGTCAAAEASPVRTVRVQSKQTNGKNSVNCQSPECSTCLQACTELPRGGHSHSHDHAAEAAAAAVPPPYGIPLNVWKVVMQTFLTSLNVFCWLVPLQSGKMADNPLALSLANAFSGGVFLSLAFCHLIPECTHGFQDEVLPFGLVLCGYLLIFFVEKVAFDAHDILHDMQSGGGGAHSHSHSHAVAATPENGQPVVEAAAKDAALNVNGGHGVQRQDPASSSATDHGSGRSALILLGALGVHSVLEMMALGLSDSFADSALLTASIALHQPAESIALLVAFVKSGLPTRKIIQYLSIFSCMGPIGVALGMAVNEYAAPIVDSIMLAVVAGTFVYVGATEVIPEEWEDSTHKWKKFGALMSGIAMIVAITQYTSSLGAH